VSAQTFVLLASAIVPPVLAIAVYWFGFRLARRHDRENPPR
jgi:hypothetical protein